MAKGKGGAPKGNKNAVGYGRPPEAYQDEDLLQLGKDMRAWMKEKDEKNEPVAFLSEFYCLKEHIPRGTWQSLIERSCFAPYYDEAKQWLSSRIIRLNQIKESYGNRILTMYSTDLDNHEWEKQKRQIDYKAEKEHNIASQLLKAPNDALIELQHQKVMLEAKNLEMQKRIHELERKANSLVCSSDEEI